jgi:hypothetical protein
MGILSAYIKDKKIDYNKKYLEDPRIQALNLNQQEFERYYIYIVSMVEDGTYHIKRDENKKIHIYHLSNDEPNSNWIYKSFLDKYSNLRLTKEHLPEKLPLAKANIVKKLLSDLENGPTSHFFYSFDSKDVSILIAYANHLAKKNKVAYVDLEEIYKKIRKNESVSNIFETFSNSEVIFLVNLRDFESPIIYSEYVLPLLKIARVSDTPIIFFSSYKINELARKIEKKYRYNDFPTEEIIKLILLITNSSEFSF